MKDAIGDLNWISEGSSNEQRDPAEPVKRMPKKEVPSSFAAVLKSVDDKLKRMAEPIPVEARHEMPAPPGDEELMELVQGTAIGTFVQQVHEIDKRIRPILPITAAYMLQSLLLSRSVTVRGKAPNMYAIIAAPRSSGKTTSANAVVQCLPHFDIDFIDNSSEKTIIKGGFAPNPWGLLSINELQSYLCPRSWQSKVLPVLTDAFDGIVVSSSSERSGKCRIFNPAPSVLALGQPDLFIESGVGTLSYTGFLARTLVALDDTVRAEFTRIPAQFGKQHARIEPILEAYRRDYAWLPRPMIPSSEDPLRKGTFSHPRALTDISVETHPHLWSRHSFPDAVAGDMERHVKNYLPLLSIPFESVENLRKGIITAKAQERGERILLHYYWSFVKFMRDMPESESEKLISRIVTAVNKRPGMLKRELQQRVRHCKPRDFAEALEVATSRHKVRYEIINYGTKDPDFKFFPVEAEPMATLDRLPPIEPRPAEPAFEPVVPAAEPSEMPEELSI